MPKNNIATCQASKRCVVCGREKISLGFDDRGIVEMEI